MTANEREIQSTVKVSTLKPKPKRASQDVRDGLRPTLLVILGEDQGQRLRLEGSVEIGRDTACDIVLQDAQVSSHHARIEERGRAWFFVDLESTNGSIVNGAECREKRLAANDKIQIGNAALRFELQDTTDLAYSEIMERLINIDDLSGLYLRRRFDMEVEKMVETSNGDASPVAMLVMDLDGIKGINDRNGHLFGAYVIAEAGKLIGRVVGERGIASRFGGDEFVAALPGHDIDGAAAVAEEIRLAIADHRFEREGRELHPGISIGIAAAPDSASDSETLFTVADEALYRAKAAGKNCVKR